MICFYKKLTFVALVFGLGGCDSADNYHYSGYSHGDFIYLSYNNSERIEKILVKKGDRVKVGQSLVQMEKYSAQNSLHQAEKNYQAESALLHNLEYGQRSQELDVTRSRLESARSAANKTHRQLARYRKLYASQVISAAEWEKINDDYIQKSSQVNELVSELKAKQLPARKPEINNQMSRVQAAKLQWDKAEWDLEQSLLTAPEDARVYDLLYRSGERPLAGKPIISLLPDKNIKVRFFVPESQLGALNIGMKVRLLCDACTENITGMINYISPEAEYTPPVIFSSKRREKLLFMAEAIPSGEQASRIKVGQPVSVEIIHGE
jgi:HlyD family secretion protein